MISDTDIAEIQNLTLPNGVIHPRDIRKNPAKYFTQGFTTASNGAISGYMKVTPETAKAWADPTMFNRDNRNPVENRVENLTGSCLRGQFMATHQGLAFDVNDILADAGKRCDAFARSNTTQEIMVTVRQPVECRRYIDGGQSRTATANVARLIDQPHTLMQRAAAAGYFLFGNDRPDADRLTDIFNILGDNLEWAQISIPPTRTHILSRAMTGAACAIAAGRNRKQLALFNDEVNTGKTLSKDKTLGPSRDLRTLILANTKPGGKRPYGDLRREEGIAYLISAHSFFLHRPCPKLAGLTIDNPAYVAARKYFNTHGVP